MKKSDMIIEGLNMKRVSKVDESFGEYEDTSICRKPRELEKVASDGLYKKYAKEIKELGADGIYVSVFTRDDDDLDLEDVIYEIEVSLSYDKKFELDSKETLKKLNTVFRRYPDFEFDRNNKEFYISVDSQEDIIELLYSLEYDKCNIKKLYSIIYASDIESKVEKRNSGWKKEKEMQDMEYWKDRV